MGRKSKGVLKVGDIYRLSLTDIIRKRPNLLDNVSKGTVKWEDGFKLKFILTTKKNENWIILGYNMILEPEESFTYDCKIKLEKYSSNLNNGYHYYFVCPVSGRRARHLYKMPKYMTKL